MNKQEVATEPTVAAYTALCRTQHPYWSKRRLWDILHSVHSPSQAHSLSTLRDIADRTRFRKLLKTHFFNSLP